RRKMLIRTILRLQYGTTAAQLRAVLDGVRGGLERHPMIEKGTSRIRLVDFGAQAIELELFAYVLTTAPLTFLAIREELLLDVTSIVEAAGAMFMQPVVTGLRRAEAAVTSKA